MIDLLSGPPAQWLAHTLLHFLWQGALVAIVLRVILAFAHSANRAYAASLVALVIMLCLPVVTFCWLSWSPSDVEIVAAASTSLEEIPIVFDFNSLQPICLTAWLLGVTLLAARLFIAWLGTLYLRGERLPLPLEIADKLDWLERRLHVAARGRVFLSTRVDEAIAIGCWRPLVLLPVAWATELPPAVLEAVIAHELAHIRRLDLWATWLQRLAETLLFYHPAVWWVSRRISIERELCCDELAVSITTRRTEYAQALETIARRKRTPSLALSTSFGGGNMNLLERVRSVLSGGTRKSLTLSSGTIAGLTPILAFAALLGWSALHLNALADDGADAKKAAQDEEQIEKKVKLTKDVDSGEKVEKKKKPTKEDGDPEKKYTEKQQVKGAPTDFNLDKFQPESEREAQLLAVIRKLQSQLKQSNHSEKDHEALKEKTLYKEKLKEAGKAFDEEDLKAKKQAMKEQVQKEYGIEKKQPPKKGEEGPQAKKVFKGEEVKKGEEGPPPKKVLKGDGVKENLKIQKEPIKKGEGPIKLKSDEGENRKLQKVQNKKGDEPVEPKLRKGEKLKENVKFRDETVKDPTKNEKGQKNQKNDGAQNQNDDQDGNGDYSFGQGNGENNQKDDGQASQKNDGPQE